MGTLTNLTAVSSAVSLPPATKRPLGDIASDTDEACDRPRKRWSGLSSRTAQHPEAGLRTPPNSNEGSKLVDASNLRRYETPSKAHQQNCPIYLKTQLTDSLALRPSPALSSVTLKSESASSYAPSLMSMTESSDEELLQRTPPLSPTYSTDEDFVSAHSVMSSTEVPSEDEVSIRTRSSTRSILKTHAKGTNQTDLPLLGYRAYSNMSHGYNSEHYFKAGLFKDSPEIPQCPAVNDVYYIAEAEKHVAIHPKPSPFISVNSKPLRALILAFRFQKRKSCTQSYLAIIDLQMLRQAGTIQKAKDLNLRPAVKYFAADECLVWGEIKNDAIVSVINIATLLISPPHHPNDEDPLAIREISKHWKAKVAKIVIRRVNLENKVFLSCCMGYAVGQFIRALGLPEYFLESAVDGIVKDWALASSRYERWQDNDIFCDSIRKGYNGTDICQSTLESSNIMTVGTSEEVIDASPSRSPIITLSDDEEEHDEGTCPGALMKAVSPSGLPVIIISDDEEDDGVCPGALIPDFKEVTTDANVEHARYLTSQVDKAFTALPACYESQMEADRMDERYHSSIQKEEEFTLLPKAYKFEMAMSE